MGKGTCRKSLRKIDLYGKSITFTYKGIDAYKTALGGSVSFIIMAFITVIVLLKVNTMINKENNQIRKSSIVRINNENQAVENLGDDGISLAFMVSDNKGNPYKDSSSIGEFKLWQQTVIMSYDDKLGSTDRQYSKQEIPLNNCNSKSLTFKNLNKKELSKHPVSSFICPQWDNLTLQADQNAPQYQYLYLEFIKCTNPKKCPNTELLQDTIDTSYIHFLVLSSYFDGDDFERPVKQFMDDLTYPIMNDQNLQAIINYKIVELDLNDNISGLFTIYTKKDKLYQLSSSTQFSQSLKNTNNAIFTLKISLDKYVDQYKRQVYTIAAVLQEVGGFKTALVFLGFITFNQIQTAKFYFSMARNLFQIQEKGMLFALGAIKRKRLDGTELKDFVYKELDHDKIENPEIFDHVMDQIEKTYQLKHLRELSHQILAQKGKDKFTQEFDVVNVVRRLRLVDKMVKLLFSLPQQILLYNQKKDVILLQDSDDDELIDHSIPQNSQQRQKLIEKYKGNLQTKNQIKIDLLRLDSRRQQIEEAFKFYQDKKLISELDRRIIMGTVSKSSKWDFTKDTYEKLFAQNLIQINQKAQKAQSLSSKKFVSGVIHADKINSYKRQSTHFIVNRYAFEEEHEVVQKQNTKRKSIFLPRESIGKIDIGPPINIQDEKPSYLTSSLSSEEEEVKSNKSDRHSPISTARELNSVQKKQLIKQFSKKSQSIDQQNTKKITPIHEKAFSIVDSLSYKINFKTSNKPSKQADSDQGKDYQAQDDESSADVFEGNTPSDDENMNNTNDNRLPLTQADQYDEEAPVYQSNQN
ncbi:UNKNOWN [Stylonychia lemnae]|uniref:Transmembrane protein n=1 Tax=Stylonychia lemnae TaxID=5949 RepID=A0A078AG34_STYLE|nr:UNKNOWN [Stylonychia lemnae]|eukprot:CDW80417.1 UNKNOWN [Stylonychia lemnae]